MTTDNYLRTELDQAYRELDYYEQFALHNPGDIENRATLMEIRQEIRDLLTKMQISVIYI